MNNLKSKNPNVPIKASLTFQQYSGLEYLTITHIPVLRIGDAHPPPKIIFNSKLNQAIATRILRANLPIRGKELYFFRTTVSKLSLEKFSRELNVSSVTIFNWEQEPTRRLHIVNEVAIRALIAEKLNLTLKLRLLGPTTTSISIKISAKKLIKFNELKE